MMKSVILKTGTTALAYKRAANAKDENDVTPECDKCHLSEITVEASGFCLHCKKYMCTNCRHDHQTTEPTKAHIIFIGSEMPKIRTGGQHKVVMNQCEKHIYKMADFFCPKHVEVFCKDCKDFAHASCQNVNYVRHFANGIKSRRDLPRMVQEIHRLIMNFEKIKTHKETLKQNTEDKMTECLKAVHELKKIVDAKFDALEKDMRKTIEKRFDKELNELNEVKRKCDSRISVLQQEVSNLDVIKTGDESQCFVTLLRAKQNVSDCETVYSNMSKDKREVRLEFEPNYKLMHFLKELDALGSIKASVYRPPSASTRSLSSTPSLVLPSNMMSALKKDKDFFLCGEYDITADDDTKSSCSIIASSFLPDGRLLVCDAKNRSLKLLDHGLQLKSTHKLMSTPYDVAPLNNREAVVTLPDRKELQFVVMDPVLRNSRVVSTEIACQGIRCHKDGLLVTCYSHGVFGMVQFLDYSGVVKQRFERDIEGNPLFQGPFHIALNPKRDRFYVSDRPSNSVLGLTMGGKVLFRYHSKDLDSPGYVAVDKDGSIYICGRDSKNIHVVKPDGRKIKTLLESEGLEPSSICCRAADGLFVVSVTNSSLLKAYKLL